MLRGVRRTATYAAAAALHTKTWQTDSREPKLPPHPTSTLIQTRGVVHDLRRCRPYHPSACIVSTSLHSVGCEGIYLYIYMYIMPSLEAAQSIYLSPSCRVRAQAFRNRRTRLTPNFRQDVLTAAALRVFPRSRLPNLGLQLAVRGKRHRVSASHELLSSSLLRTVVRQSHLAHTIQRLSLKGPPTHPSLIKVLHASSIRLATAATNQTAWRSIPSSTIRSNQ